MSTQSEETGAVQTLATMQHLCGVRLLIVWHRGKKKSFGGVSSSLFPFILSFFLSL